jgi:hypothetical protein
MVRLFSKYAAMVIVVAVLALAKTGSTQEQGLVDLLVSQLGVTSEQATGGSGAIFNLAKERLTPEQFSGIADSVPGIDTMLGAAPTAGETAEESGEMSSMTDMLSEATGSTSSLSEGAGGSMGGLGSLVAPFGQLGMSPDMVQKFVPVVLDYVNSQGGASAMQLLQGALL